MASTYATQPWAIAFNKIAMHAIKNDPEFKGGYYDEKQVAKNIAIKVARAEKDMTQKALAEAVGVSRQTMNAIEKGEYNPTIKLCRKICRVLNKSLDDLFWEDEEDEEREE